MKKQFLTLLMSGVLLTGCSYLCADDTSCPYKKADYKIESSLFAFDSAKLCNKAKENLDKVAKNLKESDKQALVNGYTDSTGSAAYNQKLSERRAKAVASYLEKEGVDAKNLTVKGYGATDFVASNDTAEGRAKNRRVDIIVK